MRSPAAYAGHPVSWSNIVLRADSPHFEHPLAEDLAPEDLKREGKHSLPRLYGALLKNEQDVQLFERLAFMARGQR